MEKFKVKLSVVVGSIFMIIPLYQVVMYGLILTDKINYYFITFCLTVSIIAFWGRLKVLAKTFQDRYSGNKIDTDNNSITAKDKKKKGGGATTPGTGF